MTPLAFRLRIRSVQVPIYGVSAGIANIETDVESIVQGLRSMEDDHPFDAQMTRPELLGLVLAALSRIEGAGMDPHSLVRAALCQEITRREDAEREITTLRRERDEARAILRDVSDFLQEKNVDAAARMADDIEERVRPYGTTPTPGAQP